MSLCVGVCVCWSVVVLVHFGVSICVGVLVFDGESWCVGVVVCVDVVVVGLS